MQDLLDLDSFPLDQPDSARYQELVSDCRICLANNGLFNLPGFLRPEVARTIAAELEPIISTSAFTHKRQHNIYFSNNVSGIAHDHPALRRFETINRTLCADQISDSAVMHIYQYQPLVNFLADVTERPHLFLMKDPLACMNVMSYREGEALHWHFDRAEFTTTLLLQAPKDGGDFEYRSDLRSEDDPNYSGVAKLLNGEDSCIRKNTLAAGTLNVFRGKNTAHRVTSVVGEQNRIISVFSYYEKPGVMFSDEERIGFYGRAT